MPDGIPLVLGRSFWAVEPNMLPLLAEARLSPDHLEMALNAPLEKPQAYKVGQMKVDARGAKKSSSVAVVPLSGVLTPRTSLLSLLFGGGESGLKSFQRDFQEAMNDDSVDAVVIDVDSPGGVVSQIPETADMVASYKGTKPMVAVANSMMASAAYWIGAQADELVVTPSGSVGSIGVYMTHTDWSKNNEKIGVNVTFISAGKYKVEGNPEQPLSKEGHEEWQAEANQLYGMFVESVARGRNVAEGEVREGMGQGRTAIGSRAVEQGLADRVDTLENVVSGLLGGTTADVVEVAVTAAALPDPKEWAKAVAFELRATEGFPGEPEEEPDEDDDDEDETLSADESPVFPELEFAD